MADTSAQTWVSWQEQVQTGLARAAQRDELPAEIISPMGKYVLAASEAYSEAKSRELAKEVDRRVSLLAELHPAEMMSVRVQATRKGAEEVIVDLAKVLGMPADSTWFATFERVKLLVNAASAP